MIGWIVIFAATGLMCKVAEMGGRNPAVWGPVTFLLCFGCAATIPLPLINIIFGLVLSYVAMVIVSIIKK